MKTIGETLRQYREKRGVSPAQLSKITRVPLSFIEALESQQYSNLPAFAFSQGYVLLLAQELGVAEETALALLRRDIPLQTISNQRQRTRQWRNKIISPRFLSLTVLGAIFLVCAITLGYQWRKLGQPPKLLIQEPSNAAIVQSPVRVRGQADATSTVTINTQVISLDPQGNFSYDVELPEGERALVIQATDHRSRQSEKILFITVEP